MWGREQSQEFPDTVSSAGLAIALSTYCVPVLKQELGMRYQAWWHMPLISALERLTEADLYEFKAGLVLHNKFQDILGYVERVTPPPHCLKQTQRA